MGSRPISWVKAHLAQVVADARESSEPLIITQNGTEAAVVISAEEWKRSRETLVMLKLIAMSERDVALGRLIPQEQVFRELRQELAAQGIRKPRSRRRR